MQAITLTPAGPKEILLGEAFAIGSGRSETRPTQAHLAAIIQHYRDLQAVNLVPAESEAEYDARQWHAWRDADARDEEMAFRRREALQEFD